MDTSSDEKKEREEKKRKRGEKRKEMELTEAQKRAYTEMSAKVQRHLNDTTLEQQRREVILDCIKSLFTRQQLERSLVPKIGVIQTPKQPDFSADGAFADTMEVLIRRAFMDMNLPVNVQFYHEFTKNLVTPEGPNVVWDSASDGLYTSLAYADAALFRECSSYLKTLSQDKSTTVVTVDRLNRNDRESVFAGSILRNKRFTLSDDERKEIIQWGFEGIKYPDPSESPLAPSTLYELVDSANPRQRFHVVLPYSDDEYSDGPIWTGDEKVIAKKKEIINTVLQYPPIDTYLLEIVDSKGTDAHLPWSASSTTRWLKNTLHARCFIRDLIVSTPDLRAFVEILPTIEAVQQTNDLVLPTAGLAGKRTYDLDAWTLDYSARFARRHKVIRETSVAFKPIWPLMENRAMTKFLEPTATTTTTTTTTPAKVMSKADILISSMQFDAKDLGKSFVTERKSWPVEFSVAVDGSKDTRQVAQMVQQFMREIRDAWRQAGDDYTFQTYPIQFFCRNFRANQQQPYPKEISEDKRSIRGLIACSPETKIDRFMGILGDKSEQRPFDVHIAQSADDLAQYVSPIPYQDQKHIVFWFTNSTSSGFNAPEDNAYPHANMFWPESTPEGMMYSRLAAKNQLLVLKCVGVSFSSYVTMDIVKGINRSMDAGNDILYLDTFGVYENLAYRFVDLKRVIDAIAAAQQDRSMFNELATFSDRPEAKSATREALAIDRVRTLTRGFLGGPFKPDRCMACGGEPKYECGCGCGGYYCSGQCAKTHWPIHSKQMKT